MIVNTAKVILKLTDNTSKGICKFCGFYFKMRLIMNSRMKRFLRREERISRRRSNRAFPDATREDIDRAMKDYLAKGGKIKRIEPEWIEDGEIYIFDPL